MQRSEHHEARVRELCREYGCTLMRFGKGWRVVSQKVDVLASDLEWIKPQDMWPVKANSLAVKGR